MIEKDVLVDLAGSRAEKKPTPPSHSATKKLCERCGVAKLTSSFLPRDDRPGYYAWCSRCMKREGRLEDTRHSQMQRERGYIDVGN